MRQLWTLLLLVGCSPAHKLEPRWEPLVQVVEADVPAAAMTVGHTVYVPDLEDFLARPDLEFILLHEQVHSQRQLEGSLTWWLTRYLFDREFALDEELLAWAIELQARKAQGWLHEPEYYASALAKYRNAVGPLISYRDALTWVKEAID